MSSSPDPTPIGSLDDLAARLERERLDADRRYNDALTAFDAAVREAAPALAPEQALVHQRLIEFVQTFTGFIETKDRAIGGNELRDEIVRGRARMLELQRSVAALSTLPVSGAVEAVAPATGHASGNVTGATYLGFEDQFRGSRDDIRARQADYVAVFAGASDVLDVGCGRGELLDLLRAAGITSRGVDINPAMVAACRERGLDAHTADAVTYLDRMPDGSLGGLIALQVVEHLEPPLLVRFLETAFLKLRPGAPIVLETINAACWMAFFETYIRDLTHARPLHPDTLKFLVTASGFSHADIRFRAPVEAADRLPRVVGTTDPAQAALVDAINAHADRLNTRLFSAMDYAVIARR